VLLGLLLAEYLLLSLSVDAHSVLRRGGLWAYVGHAGALGPLAVVAAAALAVVTLDRSRRPAAVAAPVPRWRWLVGHGLLAVGFGLLTLRCFGPWSAPSGPAAVWLSAWAASGLASAATAFHALVGDWRWLGRAALRAFPVAGALSVTAWLAGVGSAALWSGLSGATFESVARLLSALGFTLEVNFTDRVIGLDGFYVAVAPVCSGVEGMGLFLVLMTGFLVHYRASLRFPQAFVLLPAGAALIWLGNSARIAALMVLGARVDPALAIGSFHSKAGWVFFCAITVGVAALARSTSLFTRREDAARMHERPATAWVMPLVLWLAVGMGTSSFAAGPDPLFGLAVCAGGLALWRYRVTYRAYWVRPGVAAFAVGVGVGVAWVLLPSAGSASPPATWPAWLFGVWVVSRAIGSVIVAPICEELAFRGFLARWLTGRDFEQVAFTELSALAIVGSSVVFGLLHARWTLAILSGLAYVSLLRRTGRFVDVVVAHISSNAIIALWVIALGDWGHW
jgi:exosortase E/protease (VPEID-CTERM system)